MSEADKMFEELGYKKDIDAIYGTTRYNHNDKAYINFIEDTRAVTVNTIVDNEIFVLDIDMNLLKAINEKCKELGWL